VVELVETLSLVELLETVHRWLMLRSLVHKGSEHLPAVGARS